MRARNAKRLKELESENGRLKNLLTEAELDVEIGAEGLQSRTVNAPVSWSSRFGVSLRRACNVVGHTDPRNGSTLHRCPTKRLGDESSFETSRAVVLAGGDEWPRKHVVRAGLSMTNGSRGRGVARACGCPNAGHGTSARNRRTGRGEVAGHQRSSASTTAPISSKTSQLTGAVSTAPPVWSSIQDRPERAPGLSPSKAGYVTSYRMADNGPLGSQPD